MQKLLRSDDAVTGVIIALLLFGLVVIVLTTIQTVYVPQWVEQQEGAHMNHVASQFALLKQSVDIQLLTQQKTAVSNPITLGTEMQSFLSTSRSYGKLEIIEDDLIFTFANTTDEITYSLGVVRYQGSNTYYVDKDYILEGGAIIVSQSQGNVMTSPLSTIINPNNKTLILTLVNVSAIGDNTAIYGFGTFSVTTNYSETHIQSMVNVSLIRIISRYPYAWHQYLNNTMQDLAYVYSMNYTIEYNESSITLMIQQSTNLDILLNIAKIYGKINLGWIQ